MKRLREFLKMKLFFERTWFRQLVARQCYGLTHEFVTNKLHDSFYAGIGSPNYASLMELDRAMKQFTKEV